MFDQFNDGQLIVDCHRFISIQLGIEEFDATFVDTPYFRYQLIDDDAMPM